MKTKSLFRKIIFIITLMPNFIFAQWIPNPPDRLVTDDRVGIGPVPTSALDINSTLMTASAGFNLGEVFRTQAPTANTQAWRMFSGTGAGTQKFNITNVGTSNNVNLAVVQNGNMNFFTNTFQRMTILGGASNPLGGGYVGIATAAQQLVLYQPQAMV